MPSVSARQSNREHRASIDRLILDRAAVGFACEPAEVESEAALAVDSTPVLREQLAGNIGIHRRPCVLDADFDRARRHFEPTTGDHANEAVLACVTARVACKVVK